MRATLVATALTLVAPPVLADGPALAHLTVAGTTITLTGGDVTDAALTFSQMHLGFPLPPILVVDVTGLGDGGEISVDYIALNAGDGGMGTGDGTPLGHGTFVIFEPGTPSAQVTEAGVLITVPALTRTAFGQITAHPTVIEIQLTSP